MSLLNWIGLHAVSLFEHGAVAAGLFFTGFSYYINTKERRLDNLLRFTEQHHKIWSGLLMNAGGERIMSDKIDGASITQEELQSINFLFLHLHSVFRAAKVGLYRLPEQLNADVKEFFSLPLPKAAWLSLKANYNKDFVSFVDGILAR